MVAHYVCILFTDTLLFATKIKVVQSLLYIYYTNDASSKDFFSFFSVKKQIFFFGEKGIVEDDVKEPIFVAHNKMSDQDPERVHGDQTMLYKAPPRI